MLIDWLKVYFSRRCLIFFSNCFFCILCWPHNIRVVYDLPLTLLYIQNLFNYFFLWLNISFSNSGTTRDSYRNLSCCYLVVHYRWIYYLFGIHRSSYLCSSNDWSLYYSLSYYRLRNNFLCNYRLRNNFPFDKWLRNNFLGLSYLRP